MVSGRAITVVRPPARGATFDWRELWQCRDLVYFFVWRDLKVRYKQTAVGAGWAILQPVFAMVVFSVIFGRLARMPSEGVPYAVFTYAALLPWAYFASALTGASNSVADHASLLTKVYFPRLLLPLAGVVAPLADFAVASTVLVGLFLYYGMVPGLSVLLLPFFLGLALLSALAFGVGLAALNAIYRDVRYALPFLVQVWLFASPVAYPASLVPERWRTLYGLNPMAGVIEGFRWALIGTARPSVGMLAVSAAVVAALLVVGPRHFRRMEGYFADKV